MDLDWQTNGRGADCGPQPGRDRAPAELTTVHWVADELRYSCCLLVRHHLTPPLGMHGAVSIRSTSSRSQGGCAIITFRPRLSHSLHEMARWPLPAPQSP